MPDHSGAEKLCSANFAALNWMRWEKEARRKGQKAGELARKEKSRRSVCAAAA